MFWHHGANVLFAGTVESELWMWKIPTGDSKIFTAHGEKVECAKILPDGKIFRIPLLNKNKLLTYNLKKIKINLLPEDNVQ